mmetsp:Transcript_13343/g.21884  ORF Transcript_13343/g.21884 Transcript_13343/m.21884 type:complete len:365 (+) Transcript_13343:150-1244(+)|eukprot:CAMPEP_0184657776 /NCGR_PEP_ID=MMETSP0308-20130426/21764_1 /TAXON_ID=38269 /ORGANISM="Gloeochaete witrockiana, Strain SAG 46.84" /LENGTH=364 /DNA_ID=CAMNT_0027096041 /DNA_START=74 /DNA_END=1168 /DNA_ORIENTATION=+
MPKVVIVGSGGAGAFLAVNLAKNPAAEVTVVDKKGFFDWNIAFPRALVDTSVGRKTAIPQTSFLKKAKFVQGEVSSFSAQEVTVSTKDGPVSLPYDYAVIATGVSYAPWKGAEKTAEERIADLEASAKAVKDASNILIVGGGVTGVETAAEIIHAYPDKKLTIITSTDTLIPQATPKAIKFATKWLTTRGVTIITKDKATIAPSSSPVLSVQSQVINTTGGKQINTDLIISAVGSGKYNTDFLKSSLPQVLAERGKVIVDQDLRVTGFKNVFAAGDIVSIEHRQSVYIANLQAVFIAESLTKLFKNPNATLKPYKLTPAITIISLGPSAGIMATPWFTTTGFMPRALKSKDMFIGQTYKGLGIK